MNYEGDSMLSGFYTTIVVPYQSLFKRGTVTKIKAIVPQGPQNIGIVHINRLLEFQRPPLTESVTLDRFHSTLWATISPAPAGASGQK